MYTTPGVHKSDSNSDKPATSTTLDVMIKSFVTPVSGVVLPSRIHDLEKQYMLCAPDQDFEVSLSAVQYVTESGLSSKLHSPVVFLTTVWYYANKAPSEGCSVVHRRIVQNELPYEMLVSSGISPVPCEVLSALVCGIDFGNSSNRYPLSKAQNANNHVLCPLSENVIGVCILTPLNLGKLGCTSPINQRPKSFAPGSVIVFATQR